MNKVPRGHYGISIRGERNYPSETAQTLPIINSSITNPGCSPTVFGHLQGKTLPSVIVYGLGAHEAAHSLSEPAETAYLHNFLW